MFLIKSVELNNRNNSLNFLRLIFATFVLVWHSFHMLSINVYDYLPYSVGYLLSLAVPMFFVVSGYLITASAIKNDFKTYFKKRLARIYPAYFLCIVLIIVFFAPVVFFVANGYFNLFDYIYQDDSPIKFFIFNLPLIYIKPNIGHTLSFIGLDHWNGSTWTILFEFCCYIGIMLIVFLLIKIRIKKNNFPKLIFGIYLLLILFSLFYPKVDNLPIEKFNWIVYGAYFFSIFLGGSFVYLIKDKIEFSSIKTMLVSFIFCIFVMAFLPSYWAIEISAIPMTYIILSLSMMIKSPKFIQKNDISYGVYLYAWPTQVFVACIIKSFGVSINVWCYMVISWIITCGFAAFSWFLLEKPILNKVR